MALVRITPPAVQPVSLEEAKAQCRVDGSDEDGTIEALIAAAVGKLDGPHGLLGACLITQTLEATFDEFDAALNLPLPPCQSVDAITYHDKSDSEQALDLSDYRVTGLGSMGGAIITPAPGKRWPDPIALPDAITITFTAGFGDEPGDVPDPIRQAILMHVAHLFEHRESVNIGNIVNAMPYGFDDLVHNYKIWSF